VFCGNDFLCKQGNKKTCSNLCRSRLFRWRANLTRLYNEAAQRIDSIAEYLDYEGARRGAMNGLTALRKQTVDVLEKHNIRAVK